MPEVTTIDSQEAFATAKDIDISYTATGSGSGDPSYLNDGDFETVFNGGSSNCYIEITFGDNLFLDLASIRYVP